MLAHLSCDGFSSNLALRTLRPAAAEAPLLRYETAPGEQMQVDWAVFRRGPPALRLSAFVATLGYSRAAYVEFVADERLQTLLECQRRAFEYFAGVPARLLYDNMKAVVLERDAYGAGQHRFQPTLWDFARHHGLFHVCSIQGSKPSRSPKFRAARTSSGVG